MNLYFNDLTVMRDAAADIEALERFVRSFAVFSARTGAQHVWIPREMKDYLRQLPWSMDTMRLWTWANAAFGLMGDGAPSEPPDVAEHFARVQFAINRNGASLPCDQMGLAVLMKPDGTALSLTVGFDADEFWRNLHFTVCETDSASGRFVRNHQALCYTQEGQFSDADVREWCQLAYPVTLPVSSLNPQDKAIELRDDHGKDVLQAFSEKLNRSPYVEGVLASLPFKPTARRLVERCYDDGIVYLRLHWDDRGLGVKVKTTGRDIDQVERIARILTQEYDR